MKRRSAAAWCVRCVMLWAAVVATAGAPMSAAHAGDGAASSDAGHAREKDAFESAKELGTVDAWNAFLAAYPSGFHADLARAYVKKLGEQPASPQLAPSSARAAERSCADLSALRSEKSSEPTKITFVNTSGMYRAILWIDFEGNQQSYGGLNSGDQVTYDTFRTHPWMIATGPGDCLQIFLPAAEPATVDLVRLAADDPPPAKRQDPPKRQAEPQKKQKLVCAKNYTLKNGKCVLLQNCGKHAYRSPEGDCYCNKGYVMRNGKCAWPQDKQGFEVAPWKKSGCKGLQAQCSQGNRNACIKYEETCQVN